MNYRSFAVFLAALAVASAQIGSSLTGTTLESPQMVMVLAPAAPDADGNTTVSVAVLDAPLSSTIIVNVAGSPVGEVVSPSVDRSPNVTLVPGVIGSSYANAGLITASIIPPSGVISFFSAGQLITGITQVLNGDIHINLITGFDTSRGKSAIALGYSVVPDLAIGIQGGALVIPASRIPLASAGSSSTLTVCQAKTCDSVSVRLVGTGTPLRPKPPGHR